MMIMNMTMIRVMMMMMTMVTVIIIMKRSKKDDMETAASLQFLGSSANSVSSLLLFV